MALKYELKTKHNGIESQEKKKYYPVLTGRMVANTERVSEYIGKRTSLSATDVEAVISALADAIPEFLEDNYNVKLDKLGTFSVHATSKGREDPTQITSRDITGLKMSFLPSKRMKRQLTNFKVVKS